MKNVRERDRERVASHGDMSYHIICAGKMYDVGRNFPKIVVNSHDVMQRINSGWQRCKEGTIMDKLDSAAPLS